MAGGGGEGGEGCEGCRSPLEGRVMRGHRWYRSEARVMLVGAGADEQCGACGYKSIAEQTRVLIN